MKQCQTFHIWKHTANHCGDDEKEQEKTTKKQKIYALYFPEPRPSIQWKWYDNTDTTEFVPYNRDNNEEILQMEASYYANNPDNFPISNRLFRSKRSTSIFDHCFLSRLSKRLSGTYCMRYTINVTGDNGEYEINMDQMRIHGESNFARSVIRHFDREEYLRNIHDRMQSVCTINTGDMAPMYSELGPLDQKHNALIWIACFDKDNKYVVDIKRNPDVDRTTRHSVKEREFSQMVVKAVCIHEGDLVSTRCEQSYKDVNYTWAIFQKKKSKYCELVNGYWDTSFHDDENYKQLREHLDAIWTVLQNIDVQVENKLKMNTRDGTLFEDDEKYANDGNVLHVTIEGHKYELLWYNQLPIEFKKPRAHTACIKCLNYVFPESDKTFTGKKLYIMYFPNPMEKYKWQWYNNNNCEYVDYEKENELLQLESSYLANLEKNYPKDVIKDGTHRNINYFSHCLFTTLRQNLKARKRYVLRYERIQEADKLVVEQLAYSNRNSCFAREVQRISEKEFQEQHDAQPEPQPTRAKSTGKTREQVMGRLIAILVEYHKWLCLRADLRKPGMLQRLAAFYDCKEDENPIIKLKNDFNQFMRQRDRKTLEGDETTDDGEMADISDKLNTILTEKFKHESTITTKCVCVERVYTDRKPGGDTKQIYFGFADPKEIVVQQTLDSYHCFFVHNYDIKAAHEAVKSMDSKPRLLERESTTAMQRMSSMLSHTLSTRNSIKFNTYDTYDTGIRFYYWKWYKNNNDKIDNYQDRVTDPGNIKDNGKPYRFCDWFVVPAASDLKEEILSFGDHVGKQQYDVLNEQVESYLNTEHCHQLQCDTADWENKYGLKKGDAIRYEHVLAIRFYCSFTNATSQFIATFHKQDEKESDESLKKRHSKCAFMSMYLRECVEGFGTRLKKGGRGIPCEYYRGITKQFLFKKTILRFNLPTSTSVTHAWAENFARAAGGDGLTLLLKPHWGDYGGYIRAMNCVPFSDYQWEEEWLFIGGLEPLVIHNITEVSGAAGARKSYLSHMRAMNNIYQIFEGMACKFKMKPLLIEQYINNRLKSLNPNAMNDDYMSGIFKFYCDDLRAVTIKLSLMDKSYKGIAHIFMDTYSNELKLKQLIKLFPKCERITVCDGYKYQLISAGAEYKHTILSVIEECIQYVNAHKHPLETISLQSPEAMDAKLLNICEENIDEMGWNYKQVKRQNAYDENDDSSDESEFKYTICKRKNN